MLLTPVLQVRRHLDLSFSLVSLMKKKVLLLAYQTSPSRGSEYSVAWNHIVHMKEFYQLVVLVGASGEHMGDTTEIEHVCLDGVTIVSIKPNMLARCINYLNTKGIFKYAFYLAYRVWHWQALRYARRLDQTHHFDLIHYLNPIGYREPGYLWKMGKPYIWGPIGGAVNIDRRLLAGLHWKQKIKFQLKNIANSLQLRSSIRIRRALTRADVVLAATSENRDRIFEVFGVTGRHLPENAVIGPIALDQAKFASFMPIRLVWIGSIETRKALDVLIAALTQSVHARMFELHVVGDGPARASVEEQLKRSETPCKVIWHGKIPRTQVQNILKESHLHVVTSISEGNPTTIWEAMSQGVPTMAIAHCGMKDTVTESLGFPIEVTDYAHLPGRFAEELDRLSQQPDLLRYAAEKVVIAARKSHWEQRKNLMQKIYSRAILNQPYS